MTRIMLSQSSRISGVRYGNSHKIPALSIGLFTRTLSSPQAAMTFARAPPDEERTVQRRLPGVLRTVSITPRYASVRPRQDRTTHRPNTLHRPRLTRADALRVTESVSKRSRASAVLR